MEELFSIVGGLLAFVLLLYFVSLCNNIEAIRNKIAPTPKQMFKEAEIEYKLGNNDDAEKLAQRVIAMSGEKSTLGKKAHMLIVQNDYRAGRPTPA